MIFRKSLEHRIHHEKAFSAEPKKLNISENVINFLRIEKYEGILVMSHETGETQNMHDMNFKQ